LSNDPSVIASQLAVKAAKREGDSWRKVTAVDIPGVGPAARTQGIEDIAVPGDALNRTIRAVLMQTYIPVPGQKVKAITSTFRFTG
jgi:penicillin V acylase-like amidase (Ntn superfamily)